MNSKKEGFTLTADNESELCVVCQASEGDVSVSTERGRAAMLDALLERSKCKGKYWFQLDRIKIALKYDSTVWHRRCYSDFTNKTLIKRAGKLSPAMAQIKPSLGMLTPSNKSKPGTSKVGLLRSSGQSRFDDTTCMFCRQLNDNERLTEVQTAAMSASILDDSKMHPVLNVRLSGFIDLIAASAKYHLKCLVFFRREVKRNAELSHKYSNKTIVWLLSELRYAARFNQILSMNVIFERYNCLSESEIGDNYECNDKMSLLKKIKYELKNLYVFIRSIQKCSEEMDTYLIPIKYFDPLSIDRLNPEDRTILNFTPQDDDLMTMVQVAHRIRNDVMKLPKSRSIDISESAVLKCIPESLITFVQLILGGISSDDETYDQEDTKSNTSHDKNEISGKTLNLCQDIVFAVSNENVWTPKHVGLGCTLHQDTRSKELVKLFHDAGNIISYTDVLSVDDALAQETLKDFDNVTGAVVSQNLTAGTFTHFSADNIDLICGGIHVNSFNATQMAGWQRGNTSHKHILQDVKVGKYVGKLKIPKLVNTLIPINISPKINPRFRIPVMGDWYSIDKCKKSEEILKAQYTDFLFFLRRQTNSSLSWTCYNEAKSTVNPPVTQIGYMPIIDSPAHEYDTLNTVVQRCMSVTARLGQEYTVITVDQALYWRLMVLKWNIQAYQEKLIVRLGGLHIAMNFLKLIGQHMNCSGIETMWLESDMLGQNSIKMALEGKHYNRSMRSHKITLQALWRMLIPAFLEYLEDSDVDIYDELTNLTYQDGPDNQDVTQATRFQEAWQQFICLKKVNPNYVYWIQYMDMVSLLLMFTRSQRDGNWMLYLNSFTAMLPWFFRYDHTNYAKWGTVYVAEMHQLPDEVLQEFLAGNFVVKGSSRRFNQVDPDHSLEWLNAVGKDCGGITGITENSSALTKWSLTFNLRSLISIETRALISQSQLQSELTINHNESTPGRIREDALTEEKLFQVLQRYKVFPENSDYNDLQNPVTKDQATEQIQESLLFAVEKGEKQLMSFFNERIETNTSKFHDVLKKNNPLTMASLYKSHEVTSAHKKSEIVKVDRDVLQRILTAYRAGREVNMTSILQHELLPVPISLSEMNGYLRSGCKAALAEELKVGIDCPFALNLVGTSCMVIDGQALVVTIGKPSRASTFGDLSDVFVAAVFSIAKYYERVDIVFDKYLQQSIKASTRQKRNKGCQPTRRKVDSRSVPLPVKWNDFMSLAENKEDLASFLGHELIAKAPEDKVVVVSGAFEDFEDVRCNKACIEISHLRKWHEEGDTRVVLHALRNGYDNLVVVANDTDILVLLLNHYDHIHSVRTWMMTGPRNKRLYIPLHEIVTKVPREILNLLIPFHVVTGCDSTSFFYGISKKSSFKVFCNHYVLLQDLGRNDINEETMESVEQFICKLYNLPPHIKSVDKGRLHLFSKVKAPEKLPPTRDALRWHIKRCHYQAMVWYNITTPEVHQLHSPVDCGWKLSEKGLIPILMTLPPIPKGCQEIIACGCKAGCMTMRCSCKKSNLLCTDACKCTNLDTVCANTTDTA